MTKAPRAGTTWTAFLDRHCPRTKSLLVALPLLLLSLFMDHGFPGAASPDAASRIGRAGQAADMGGQTGTEGKAQLPGRHAATLADPSRYKPTPSTDGPGPQAGLVPTPSSHTDLASPNAPLGRAYRIEASSVPLAARPRAPPALAA